MVSVSKVSQYTLSPKSPVAPSKTAQAAPQASKNSNTTKIAVATLALLGVGMTAYLAYNPVPLKQAIQYVAQNVTPDAVKNVLPTAFREAVRAFANS